MSVVSCAGSGGHRKETRVEKRHVEVVGLPVADMIEAQLLFKVPNDRIQPHRFLPIPVRFGLIENNFGVQPDATAFPSYPALLA